MQRPKLVISADSKSIAFFHQARHWNGATIVMTEVHTDGQLSMSVRVAETAQVEVMIEQIHVACDSRAEQEGAHQNNASADELNFARPAFRMLRENEQIRTDPDPSVSQPLDKAVPAREVDEDTQSHGKLGHHAYASHGCADDLGGAGAAQLRRRSRSRPSPQLDSTELQRVVQHIEDNLASVIRLSDLVRLTSMSKSAFCAAFKRSTGLPPHRYHLSARVRRAQSEMLSHPKLQLAELARSLGFADPAHFGRVFRAFVGTTPRTWASGNRR